MSLLAQPYSQEEVYSWLDSQAKSFGVQAWVFVNSASFENGRLYLPVHIENAGNAYERAAKLQDLEDSWNNQEPRPEPQIFLVPARNNPPRDVAWAKVEQAMQRKLEAVDAFGNAKSSEEQEQAAAEFQRAKQAEEELLQADELMPLNQRVPQ